MTTIQCFMLTPIPMLQVNLRRYGKLTVKCPATNDRGPHDAQVTVDDKELVLGEDISGRYEHSDERWPKVCRCGYEFQPTDVWQVATHQYYTRSDNGERSTIREAPVGAIWNAEWYKGLHEYHNDDGRILMVRTPGGEWCIDGPSDDEKRWERTGEPPMITVKGSIRIGGYHGVLTNGLLEEV